MSEINIERIRRIIRATIQEDEGFPPREIAYGSSIEVYLLFAILLELNTLIQTINEIDYEIQYSRDTMTNYTRR